MLMKLISRTYVLRVLTSSPQAAQRSWESRAQPGSSLSRQGFQKFSGAGSPTAQVVNPVFSAMAHLCSCSLIPGMGLWNTVEDSSMSGYDPDPATKSPESSSSTSKLPFLYSAKLTLLFPKLRLLTETHTSVVDLWTRVVKRLTQQSGQ